MKRQLVTLMIGVVFLSCSSGAALADILTFEDLTPAYSYGTAIPGNYDGFQWANWYAADIPLYFQDFGVSGGAYPNAVVSGDWVAYDGGGHPPAQISLSTGTFNLNSVYMTAAWNDGLQVEAQGFIGAKLAYNNIYTVNTASPTLLTFDYLGVTEVNFIPSGGVPNPVYASGGGGGVNFVIDNLNITIVPEPSAFSLVGLATALMLRRFPRFLHFRARKVLPHQAIS
jgi:hypothetical protein